MEIPWHLAEKLQLDCPYWRPLPEPPGPVAYFNAQISRLGRKARKNIHFDLRRGVFFDGLVARRVGTAFAAAGNRAFSILIFFRSLIIMSRTLALPFRSEPIVTQYAFLLNADRLARDQLRNLGAANIGVSVDPKC